MNEPVNDNELERYLKGADVLSRQYAAAADEMPAAALDQAVLAGARAALEKQSSSTVRWRGWPATTALAATVLLSFGLVMRLALEPRPVPVDEQQADQAAPSSLTAPSANTAVDMQPRELQERTESAAAAGRYPVDGRKAAKAETARPPSPPPAQPYTELEKKTSESSAARTDTTADAMAPAAAAAPNFLSSRAIARERVLQRAAGSAAASAADSRQVESASKAVHARTPEAWLEEIEKLKAAGRTEEAAAELARFKEAYPDYLEKHDRTPGE